MRNRTSPFPAALSDPAVASEIVWTTEDVDRWLDMQEVVNRTDQALKVSSFPYTEGPRKFGCNPGLLHLYVSATGDVWPCDFIPLSFGNVLKESVQDLYHRLRAATGISRRRCWAKEVAGPLAGRELPLGPEDSSAFCRSCDMRPDRGDFFKTLLNGEAR